MKKTICIIIAIYAFAVDSMAGESYLVKKGKTKFKIVLHESPLPVEQTAARELKEYLDRSTGIDWVIASERDVPEREPQILVGNSSRAKELFPEVYSRQIPYDGIELHLKGNKLLLTGHEQRGAIYAVNTFLETVLGVRWWTSAEQSVPIHESLKLAPLDISYAPRLIFREAYYKDAFEPVFATQMKCNGIFAEIPPEYGDHHKFAYWCHSFFDLIPPDKYFAEHPEWFSEIDGKRRHESAQLCLSNEQLQKEMIKNAIETLRKHPGAKFISVSQMDWSGWCTCEHCSRIVEEEGSQSGPLVRFINTVAEGVEKEFPDVFVETLAYNYTRKPPMHAKPRKNVVIRLCTMGCAFGRPLTDEQNKSFGDDMLGWSEISHQLFIWDYVTNFSSHVLPHPNYHVIAPNLRFFVDSGAIGMFEQGDANCAVGDFVRMRNWVISRLMWNPSLDETELRREFVTGYYGERAAPFLLEYFDLLSDKASSSGQYIHCYQEDTGYWFDYETLCKATALFDAAIAATEQESENKAELMYRLRRDRMPLEHVWLKGYPTFKRYAEMTGGEFSGPATPEEADEKFFAFFDDYNETKYREYQPGSFDTFKEGLLFHCFGKPAPVPDELKALDPNAWMDVQEYDFQVFSLRWLPTNHFDAGVVDDPNASNGRAVVLPDRSTAGYPVRLPLLAASPLFEDAGEDAKYKVIARVRCEASNKEGMALVCRTGDTIKSVDVAEIAGQEYRDIEFESIHLTRPMFMNFYPSDDGEFRGFIDRVIIIKEK